MSGGSKLRKVLVLCCLLNIRAFDEIKMLKNGA